MLIFSIRFSLDLHALMKTSFLTVLDHANWDDKATAETVA